MKSTHLESLSSEAVNLGNEVKIQAENKAQLMKQIDDFDALIIDLKTVNKKQEGVIESQRHEIMVRDRNKTLLENNIFKLTNDVKELEVYQERWENLDKIQSENNAQVRKVEQEMQKMK